MIEIRDLSVRFGDKIVLDYFNADLPDRGCVVIRGDSGVGKTTLLRVLAGTLRQDSGTILGRHAVTHRSKTSAGADATLNGILEVTRRK